MFQVEPVAPRHASALAALFHRAGSACYCRYWHFDGTNNDWLARSADQPAESRAEMLRALRDGLPQMRGIVATSRSDGAAVGWVKVSPAASVPKLYGQRLYRGLTCFSEEGPGDRGRVHTIGCFLVDPAWRRRGVARALLGAAVELARSSGASAIEAFPRHEVDLRDEQMWMGPHELFLEQGFETVHSFQPYPVLRKTLP